MIYADFWGNFDSSTHWFIDRISECDGLCYSVFGDEYLNRDVRPKVFYTAEAAESDLMGGAATTLSERFAHADYTASFHKRPEDPNHLRMPNYVCIYGPETVKKEIRSRQDMPAGDKDVCFVASNKNARARIRLVKTLMEHVSVDCGGPVLNNVPRVPKGEYYENFIDFAKDYKFVVAGENRKKRDYTTEKLYNALRAGAVPIYYGNPDVADFFNKDAIIHCHDFESFEAVARRVVELKNDPSQYEEIRNQPALPDNGLYSKDRIETFIESNLS